MMHVSQIIMLYTLSLYSVVHKLYLNKTGRKKNTVMSPDTNTESKEISPPETANNGVS